MPKSPTNSFPDMTARKTALLDRLRPAGVSGLTRTALGITRSPVLKQALAELEKERAVANIGNRNRPLYVAREFYTPLETAAEWLDAALSDTRLEGLSLTRLRTLARKWPSAIRNRVDDAIAWLAGEGRLLKIKSGRVFLFLYVPVLRKALPALPEHASRELSLDMDRVLAAYRQVKARLGFSNVEISELRREMGIPMAELETFLMERHRRGEVILSTGDWSLASEEIRTGAVRLDGRIYLLARFPEE